MDANGAIHASIEKSNTARVPNRRKSMGMHSLSGIETAPITASARPICAGYIDIMFNEWIANRRCRALTYRES